jgi:hypothetical protein
LSHLRYVFRPEDALGKSHNLLSINAFKAQGVDFENIGVWIELLQQIGDSCHTFTSDSAPRPFYAGFGVPWNVLDPTQLLLTAFCTSSSVTADIGPATYVYNQGYGWVNSQWQQVTLTCTGGAIVQNAWCPNSASATLPNFSTYYIAYTCTWMNNKWYCGCADTNCAQHFWQLQKIR